MQTSSGLLRRNTRGYALIIIMCFLVVCLLVFASMMYWISSNSSVTARNNQFNMSGAAAEAATEKVLSQMNYDYVAQSLSNSATYYSTAFVPSLTNDQASWPIKYVYSDTNGVTGQISVNMGSWSTNTQPLNSQFAGLYGEIQPVTITATATPIGQHFTVPATVSESLQFASIPLFQFAIFYNMDLEIAAAQTLNIVGPVYSNGGIWSGSTTVTFQNTVSAVGIATNTANDPFTSPAYAGSGKSTYAMAGQPTSGNDRITMPIGTNNNPATVEGIINLPPVPYALNTAGAFTTNGQTYFSNGADLYLTNFNNGTNWGSLVPRGTNMILYYQDAWNTPYLTQIPYDFYLMTNKSIGIFSTNWVNTTVTTNINYVTNIWYAGYSFVTNALFYDWREGWNNGSGPPKAVQAIQIDVAKYNIWLTNSAATNNGIYYNTQCQLSSHKSHPIDSIYVYNAVPLTNTTLPAVRVVNGGMLPSQTLGKGFTVATAMPMYVWGNYNASNSLGSSLGQNSTTYTWPAALMGDSITILSTSWNDANSTFANKATDTGGGPSAGSGATTVNAAMLAGIVASTNSNYSGGVENFLRTLENWSSATLWYNGSIVVMFPSQYATNFWVQTGHYYSAPNRKWAFDTNFVQQAKLPPLTPQAKGVIRAGWSGY